MDSRKLVWLSAIGLASSLLYLLLALRYPLLRSLADPRASWASMVTTTLWNAVLHLAIYLALTLLYIAAMRLLLAQRHVSPIRRRQQVIVVIVIWLACSFALVAVSPAGESHDIFDYIFRGRMIVEYRANPLVDIPDELGLSIPYTRYLAWRKNVDTYGPVWEGASAAVAVSVRQVARWLGWWDESYPVCPKSFESCRLLVTYISGYRLLAIAMTGISGWLIFSIVDHNRPSIAPAALAVWLLCPMTLVASALGAHNDFIMLALVLLSWWLLQRQRLYLALIALILAAHVKLTALIWLPTCLLWIAWRWGWRRFLKIGFLSTASGLLLSWLLYAPFGGWGSLLRMLHERSAYLAGSFWRVLNTLLINRWGWTVARAHHLSVSLPNWLFAISTLIVTLWFFNFLHGNREASSRNPRETDRKLWIAMLAVSLLYIVAGSFWFQPWYVLWVIAPAALLPGSPITSSVLPWLVFGALASNVGMDFLLKTLTNTAPSIVNYVLAILIIWGPAIVAASFLALRRLTKGFPLAARFL